MYYKDLLRYRNVWLGIALLWIMLFHCDLDLGPLGYIGFFGYGGVDICIFASGIGCYYSLSSNSDALSFMKRRLKRIVPTYVIFILLWLVYQYTLGNFGWQMALGNLLSLQNFSGHPGAFNWYVGAILLMYILAPYFHSIVKNAKPQRKILFLVFLIICTVPFWRSNTYIISLVRIPLFFLGMLFADLCQKNTKISRWHIIGLIASFVAGFVFLERSTAWGSPYLWSHGLYWYPFYLLTPPLCVAISCVSMLLEKTKATKVLLNFFSLCGKYSFELYLVHVLLWSVVAQVIDCFNLVKIQYLVWAAGCVILVPGCFALRQAANLFSKLYRKSQQP